MVKIDLYFGPEGWSQNVDLDVRQPVPTSTRAFFAFLVQKWGFHRKSANTLFDILAWTNIPLQADQTHSATCEIYTNTRMFKNKLRKTQMQNLLIDILAANSQPQAAQTQSATYSRKLGPSSFYSSYSSSFYSSYYYNRVLKTWGNKLLLLQSTSSFARLCSTNFTLSNAFTLTYASVFWPFPHY